VCDNKVNDNGESGDPTHRPGDGIHAFARTANNTICENQVNDNAGNGIVLDGSQQLTPAHATIPGATNTTVTENQALGNGTSSLVLVYGPFYDLEDGNTNCDNNTWSDNNYGTKSQACID
jgi:hypothetical protein